MNTQYYSTYYANYLMMLNESYSDLFSVNNHFARFSRGCMQSQAYLMLVTIFTAAMIFSGCSKEYNGSNKESVQRIVEDARRGDSGAILREFSQSSPWITKGGGMEYAERLSKYISYRYGSNFVIAESASGKGLDGKNFELIWITNDRSGGKISFLFLQNGTAWGLNSYSIVEKDTNDIHFRNR